MSSLDVIACVLRSLLCAGLLPLDLSGFDDGCRLKYTKSTCRDLFGILFYTVLFICPADYLLCSSLTAGTTPCAHKKN